MWKHFVATAGIAVSVTACTANDTAVFRSFNPEGTDRPSVLVDAKQRAIITVSREDDNGKNMRMFCAEPSPDALSAISSAFATSLSVGIPGRGEGAGALGTALTEAASQLGTRNATIQLLRDGFYRLCEASLNASLTKREYQLLANKYVNSMVTLLAIEQLLPTGDEEVQIVEAGDARANVDAAIGAGGEPPSSEADATAETAAGSASDASPATADGEPSDDDGQAVPGVAAASDAAAGGPAVGRTVVKGGKTEIPSHIAKAVAFMVGQFLRQSRFGDCLLMLDGLHVDSLDFGLENDAAKATVEGCKSVLITAAGERPDLVDIYRSSEPTADD